MLPVNKEKPAASSAGVGKKFGMVEKQGNGEET